MQISEIISPFQVPISTELTYSYLLRAPRRVSCWNVHLRQYFFLFFGATYFHDEMCGLTDVNI